MSTIISTVRESDNPDDSFDDDSEVEGLQHNDWENFEEILKYNQK